MFVIILFAAIRIKNIFFPDIKYFLAILMLYSVIRPWSPGGLFMGQEMAITSPIPVF